MFLKIFKSNKRTIFLCFILIIGSFLIIGCEKEPISKKIIQIENGCSDTEGGNNPTVNCNDGIDNDCDNYIDYEDSDGSCTLSDGQCEVLYDNGPNTIKIILVSDGYG